jgi:hypothetical protein
MSQSDISEAAPDAVSKETTVVDAYEPESEPASTPEDAASPNAPES